MKTFNADSYVIIELWDKQYSSFGYELSRLLTETDDENEEGLFSNGVVFFKRGEKTVEVEFNTSFETCNSFQEVFDEIKRRVKLVKDTFDKIQKVSTISIEID